MESRPTPHAFPPRLPFYAWACFQFAAVLYLALIASGILQRKTAPPEHQAFLFAVFFAMAALAVILGFMLRIFMRPEKEADSARYLGRFMIRLVLQCGFFEMPGLAAVMISALGVRKEFALPLAMASLLLIGSLLPWTLRGIERYETILLGKNPESRIQNPESRIRRCGSRVWPLLFHILDSGFLDSEF